MQIVSQVRVGIASGDLRPGDRLPSTREIARRFGVHANTVSAAYRELAAAGMVHLRKGSGIYIRESDRDVLDALIDAMFRDAARAGFTRAEVLSRISASGETIGSFSLYEPDPGLAAILAFEIRGATGLGVNAVAGPADLPSNSLLVALFDEREHVREAFADAACVFLTPTSVAATLAGRPRPGRAELVAVASGWEDFLTFARLYLLAAGLEADSILTVRAAGNDWKRRLAAATMVICDMLTASQLADGQIATTFPVISADSIDELRRCARSADVPLR